MFAGVEWGGPAALQQTLSAARACGLTIETGPLWYDVDSPADLERLRREPGLPPRTAAWFARHPRLK